MIVVVVAAVIDIVVVVVNGSPFPFAHRFLLRDCSRVLRCLPSTPISGAAAPPSLYIQTAMKLYPFPEDQGWLAGGASGYRPSH